MGKWVKKLPECRGGGEKEERGKEGRDSSVFISDGEFGLELRGYGGANLEVGDVLEAAGFPSMGGLERGLDGVVLRTTGRRRLERHQEIEAEEALAGGVDSRLVRLEGRDL